MRHFAFDEFRLDPADHRLWKGEAAVPLPPKAFDTLVYLAENRGRLVTRGELMQAVWPDSFVEGANLTVYISLLRKALGEDGGRRYIETVPRKGYRFTADVRAVNDGTAPEENAPTAAGGLPDVAIPAERQDRRRIGIWAAAIGVLLVCGALGMLMVRPRPKPPVRRVRLTSFGPELAVTAAALSPDGRTVAFANASGVFVQQIDTGEAHPLATPAAGFTALSIGWFPDGGKLLLGGFAAQADTPGLWVVQAMGSGAPVKIADGLIGAVSPDGAEIAISGSTRLSPPESSGAAAPEIRLIRSDGEGMRTLAAGQPGETFGPVAWRSGGRRLLWVRYRWDPQFRKNAGSICELDLNSGRTSALLTATDVTGDVAALDGERVAYAQLLGANPSSKYGARLLARGPDARTSLLEESPEPIAGLSTDAAGTRLSLRRAVADHSVFIAAWSAAAQSLSDIRRLTAGLGREDFPRAWTPDSRSVVFDSNRNGTWELFRQALDATADQPLLHSADDSFTPRLSPDGSSFLYIDRPKNWAEPDPVSIMRTPVSGGAAQLVLQASGISEWGLRLECAGVAGRPCVLAQRQGGQIAFRAFDPVRGFDEGGGEVARIDFDAGHPVAWTLAPDGSRLAWARWDANRARIRVVPLQPGAAGAEVELRDCSHLHSLHWTADGKGWFVTSEWPVSWTLSYADLEGRVRVLTRGSGTHAPDAFPSPDGRRVAFSQQVVESNVWLLEGF